MVVKRDCPHCGAASVGMTAVWDCRRPTKKLAPMGLRPAATVHVYDVLALCGACHAGVVLVIYGTVDAAGASPRSADSMGVSNWGKHPDQYRVAAMYPASYSPTAPSHTPEPIAQDFIDGLRSMQHGIFTGAGVLFRKALQRATTVVAKREGVQFKANATLQRRILELANQHHLTPAMSDLAGVIRLDGNAAAHDENEEFDAEKAEQMREFVELFLAYAFTLPERVKLAQQPKSPPSTSATQAQAQAKT